SRPLTRAIAVPRSTTSLNGVSDACALAGGACIMRKSFLYSSTSGSCSASKYAGGILYLLGLPILDGNTSVRSLYAPIMATRARRSEEHTSELQSLAYLVCPLPL